MNENELAELLFAAQRDAELLAPPREAEELSAASAYRVQDRLLELRLAAGEHLVGLKLGFTSLAKQRQMDVYEPVTGFLTDAMQVPPGRLGTEGLCQPRVEPEIAFRLGTDLGGEEVDRAAVIAATSEVVAAIEVLDSRYRDFRFNLPSVVADNTSAARFVLAPSGVDPADIDLVAERVEFRAGAGEPTVATGKAVLDDPAAAVAWLARRKPLRAGQIVLSGGMMDAFAVAPGDRVSAAYSSLGEITLEVV